MKPVFHFHGPPLEFLGIEIIYFIAIVAMSMYIYIKSREIFNLTKHKGVDYFSNIFLFFSLAYLLRLWNVFSGISDRILGINIWERTFYLDFLLLGYFSTVAVIYLILTSLHRVMEKKFEPPEALRKLMPVITPGTHTDILAAYESTLRIKELADILIPIHDPSYADVASIP